jgi:hypothetical protein
MSLNIADIIAAAERNPLLLAVPEGRDERLAAWKALSLGEQNWNLGVALQGLLLSHHLLIAQNLQMFDAVNKLREVVTALADVVATSSEIDEANGQRLAQLVELQEQLVRLVGVPEALPPEAGAPPPPPPSPPRTQASRAKKKDAEEPPS